MKGESTPRPGLYRRVCSAAALVFLALGNPALAGFDTGAAAFRNGGYHTALHELSPPAENGDAEAQFLLGSMFEGGLGVEQSYAEAIKWYGRADERGLVRAQYHLGLLYAIGEGVGRNHAIAAEWYRRAAGQGYAPAQNNLAYLYLRGWGVANEPIQAYLWSSLAAQQNYPGAARQRIVAKRSLSRGELREAEALVEQWKPEIPQVSRTAPD